MGDKVISEGGKERILRSKNTGERREDRMMRRKRRKKIEEEVCYGKE